MHSSDRIERKILLKVPRSTVWRVVANAEAFGQWFGVALEGQRFVAGERTQGQITFEGYKHLLWDVKVERVEPERRVWVLLDLLGSERAVEVRLDDLSASCG